MSLITPLPIEVTQWLDQQVETLDYSIYQLAGDASARKYYRVIKDDKTWILMFWEPFEEDKYPFISVQKHFQLAGVNVPETVSVGGDLGVMLLNDLGDLTLERKFWESSSEQDSKSFYLKSIDELIKIHRTATELKVSSTATTTQFNTAKFVWEMNYAKEHLIEGVLQYKLSSDVAQELEKTFLSFCEKLHQQPKVICHRDYHSRNIMLKLDQVCVIDFQDARMGPIQYDLVSLFKDSYVDISDQYAQELMSYYLDYSGITTKKGFSIDQFNEIYELQSIQRCFKACGSFASFMNTRQDKRYLKYLSSTLKQVLRALSNFNEYKPLMDVLIDSGSLDKNYERM